MEDFAKVTDINDPDPRITLDPNEWIKSVQFKVEGNKLKVIRTVEVSEAGRVQTRRSSTATSDCESFNPPLKQPKKAP